MKEIQQSIGEEWMEEEFPNNYSTICKIIDTIFASCYEQAKWLVQEFKSLPPLMSFAAKNSFK